jgi:hypothetical protein
MKLANARKLIVKMGGCFKTIYYGGTSLYSGTFRVLGNERAVVFQSSLTLNHRNGLVQEQISDIRVRWECDDPRADITYTYLCHALSAILHASRRFRDAENRSLNVMACYSERKLTRSLLITLNAAIVAINPSDDLLRLAEYALQSGEGFALLDYIKEHQLEPKP